jgi:hypothetical protein
MQGIPKQVDWFVAANSLGAHDMLTAEMMGFDWRNVEHLVQAHKRGFMPERKEVNIIGDLDALKRQFVLNRTMWNYPALFAFHSQWATKLVYLSRFSKLIHDVMYLVRKRPID